MKSSTPIYYKKVLILLDIRSSHNVGSLFRTSDAVGVDRIYLVGTTPTPLDRFERPNSDIAKTALGAEKTIPYIYYATITDVFDELKKDDFSIVAIEQSEDAIDYKTYIPTKNTAVILGNEVEGVPLEALSMVDTVLEIPMQGGKESLNVSVAGGIALYRLFDR